jgi:hypothetical protein
MHNAPSVTYPVGRPRFAGLLAAGLWLAGSALTLLWLHEAHTAHWRHAFATLALLVSGGWAFTSWWRSPQGQLSWDGAAWSGPFGAGADGIEVTLDLQRVLLVRVRTGRTAHWLWLDRRRCPLRWLDLRRAVYSRARPPALPPARPPVATP